MPGDPHHCDSRATRAPRRRLVVAVATGEWNRARGRLPSAACDARRQFFVAGSSWGASSSSSSRAFLLETRVEYGKSGACRGDRNSRFGTTGECRACKRRARTRKGRPFPVVDSVEKRIDKCSSRSLCRRCGVLPDGPRRRRRLFAAGV